MKYVRDVRTVDSQTAVVICQGGLSTLAVEEIHQAVAPLLDGSVFHLVFDLTRVEYVGSRVFEILEAAQDQVKKRRGRVSLVGTNSLVRQFVEMFSLDLMFDLYGKMEELPAGVAPKPDKAKKEWSANVRKARAARKTERIRATGVRFAANVLYVSLGDGREIGVSLDRVEWLGWLAKATPRQRARWLIEPEGLAIYWEDLDDGVEVRHLLEMQPLV